MAKTTLDLTVPSKVSSVLSRLGLPVTFHVPSSRSWDNATRTTTESGVNQLKAQASPLFDVVEAGRDGRDLHSAKLIVDASGLNFTPEEGHRLDAAGSQWNVVQVEPIRTGTLVAAYEVTVER